MPKLDENTMEVRRHHIMLAALRCFVNQGFAASTVDKICAEARISKGAFYTHFTSKDAIIQAVAERRKKAFDLIDGSSLEAFERSIVETLIKPFLGNPECRFELEVMAASGSNPDLQEAVGVNTNLIDSRFRAILQQLIETGAIRIVHSASEVARILNTYLIGIVAREGARMGDDDMQTLANFEIFFRSLALPQE